MGGKKTLVATRVSSPGAKIASGSHFVILIQYRQAPQHPVIGQHNREPSLQFPTCQGRQHSFLSVLWDTPTDECISISSDNFTETFIEGIHLHMKNFSISAAWFP